MSTLEQGFQQQLEQFPALTGMPILISVSGGVDSVTLLNLFTDRGHDVSVMHCNFQLRGKESDEDEAFVKSICKSQNIPFFSKRFSTTHFAKSKRISTQMAARRLRIEFTNELINTYHFSCVCLAHHLNDSIETFFLNLNRGTGIRGLKSMAVYSKPFFRPLLFASRQDITDYVQKKELQFREDSSNASDDYLRNKIRHHIIPAFCSFFPDFESRMQQNILRFSDTVQLLDVLCKKAAGDFCSDNGNTFKVDLKSMKTKGYPDQLLGEIITPFGFSYVQVAEILTNINKKETSRYICPEYTAYLKNQILEIEKNATEQTKQYMIFSLEDFTQANLPVNFRSELLENSRGLNLSAGKEHAFFDMSLIRFPLCLRKPASGDKFQPFGMKGKKLLSDFFTDLKLSQPQKNKIWLLCSGEDILWVCGLRISHKFRVKKPTSSILHLFPEPVQS
jgi:tRNA(Ile)-lysidine synthase